MPLTIEEANTVLQMLEIVNDESLGTLDMFKLAARVLEAFPTLEVPDYFKRYVQRQGEL